MTNNSYMVGNDLLAHLYDLQNKSVHYNIQTESYFLNESELIMAMEKFPPSTLIRYDGGYASAKKKKVIFCREGENDLSDIVCIRSRVNQKFKVIEHRDILGALMSLQIDRHQFGDFWIDHIYIYIYTSKQMAKFLCKELTQISCIRVMFEIIDEHPEQVFLTREIKLSIASERADAIVAGLSHCSRTMAKEMIRSGCIYYNHKMLAAPDKVCDNSCIISIRGVGRFQYLGISHQTKKERMIAVFLQSIS